MRQFSIAIIARRRAPESDIACCSRKAGPKRRNTSATSSPSRGMVQAVRVATLAVAVCKASSGLTVAQTLLVAIRR